MSDDRCDRCGRHAQGFAMIGDRRLCHPDYGHSCYQEDGFTHTWTSDHLKNEALRAALGTWDLDGMTSVEYVRDQRDW